MTFDITVTQRFEERLNSLPDDTQQRIIDKLHEFQQQLNDYGIDPRQHNNTKFIADMHTWRLRIGQYRAFFDIGDQELRFTTVLHRDNAYRQ